MEHIGKICDKKLIIDNGYVYLYSKTRAGKVYWDCKRGKNEGTCNARAITIAGSSRIIKGPSKSNHLHPKDPEEAKAEIITFNLKRKATENPEQPPELILQNELRGVSSGILSKLPDKENLKKTIRRKRRAELPPNPTSLDELQDIPERYKTSLGGDRFLISGNDGNGGRGYVFSTRRNLQLLARSEMWFLDGTFKVNYFFFLVHFYYE